MIDKHFNKIAAGVIGAGMAVVLVMAGQDARGQEIKTDLPQDDQTILQNLAPLDKPDMLVFKQPMTKVIPVCDISWNPYCDMAPPRYVGDFVSPPPIYTWS